MPTDNKTTSASLALFARLISILYSRPVRSRPVPVKPRLRLSVILPDRRPDEEPTLSGLLTVAPGLAWQELHMPPTSAAAASKAFPVLPVSDAVPLLPRTSVPQTVHETLLGQYERTVAHLISEQDLPKRKMVDALPAVLQSRAIARSGLTGLDHLSRVASERGEPVSTAAATSQVATTSQILPPLTAPFMLRPTGLPSVVVAGRRVDKLPANDGKSGPRTILPTYRHLAARPELVVPNDVLVPTLQQAGLDQSGRLPGGSGIPAAAASIPPPSTGLGWQVDRSQAARLVLPAQHPLQAGGLTPKSDVAAHSAVSDHAGMDTTVQLLGNVVMNGRQLGRVSANTLARDASLPMSAQSRPNIRSTTLYTGMRIPQ